MDHPTFNFPEAPQWSLAIGSVGSALIWLALLVFLGAAILGTRQSPRSLIAFRLGASLLFAAFVSLGLLFVLKRFEFIYVFQHGDASNTVPYQIAGIWAGQEGSFLLWACTSALFGWLALKPRGEAIAIARTNWSLTAYSFFLACLCGILSYETPFKHQPLLDGKLLVPPNGAGLSPTLQNYWVTIHPPTIFMGFGSLTVLFAMAFGALMVRDYSDWAKSARPWALVSLSFLGLGLCMGGFWAYETLGWGGFWMWDPVENVSFVPWIMTAILVHGLIVQSTKGKWQRANLMFAGLPFLTFVYGTFLTRAGFLDGVSVHSFAQMNHVAHMVLLGFFAICTIGFLATWFMRAPKPAEQVSTGTLSRESGYKLSMILLGGLAASTAFGMSVPLFQAMAGKKPKIVDEHLYHLVLSWFFVPIMILIAIGPFLSWRKMGGAEFFGRILNVLSISMGLLGIALLVVKNPSSGMSLDSGEGIRFPFNYQVSPLVWLSVLLGICILGIVGNVWRIFELKRSSLVGWGPFIAHIGVATLMTGLIISRGFERKAEIFVQEGVPARAFDYLVTYKGRTSDFNDRQNKLLFDIANLDGRKFEARPGMYYSMGMDGSSTPVTWPHIEHSLWHDDYLALHPQVLEASDVITVSPGETKAVPIFAYAEGKEYKFQVSYAKLNRIGEFGQPGTRFEADLKISTQDGDFSVKPSLQIEKDGIKRNPGIINDDYYVNMIGMQAGKNSISIQVNFLKPVYPIEFYFKPMTILVWSGTAIMTLGGLLSAFGRRRKSFGSDSNESTQASDTIVD